MPLISILTCIRARDLPCTLTVFTISAQVNYTEMGNFAALAHPESDDSPYSEPSDSEPSAESAYKEWKQRKRKRQNGEAPEAGVVTSNPAGRQLTVTEIMQRAAAGGKQWQAAQTQAPTPAGIGAGPIVTAIALSLDKCCLHSAWRLQTLCILAARSVCIGVQGECRHCWIILQCRF